MLANQVADELVTDAEAATLADRTGGNPFFVSEYARLPRAERVGTEIPLAVKSVLDRRLAGLDPAVVQVLRTAAGSLLTGLQTMPSVAWFPLAILLFQLSEAAILAVVVLGAAPSIATGLLNSFDQVPPLLVRAGRVMGARGLGLYRHIILPAALPGFLTGLKQGWAFAWRSLMAGELLVIIGHAPSIGVRLQFSRELSDAEGLLAWMIVVMVLGVLIDGLVFGTLERVIHRRRGLTGLHG